MTPFASSRRFPSDRNTPPRSSTWAFVLASAALHAVLAFASLLRQPPAVASTAPEPALWLESLAKQPEPQAVPAPAPEPPAQPTPQTPRRTRTEPPPRAAETTAAHTEPKAPAVVSAAAPGLEPGAGTLAVAAEGTGLGGAGEPGAGAGTGTAGTAAAGAPQPEREQGPAQLSLWLDPQELARMALVRPAIGLLMSVPGYRDLVRGSGIRPFSDLQRLRMTLTGVSAERLTLAGVHLGGAQALTEAAARVAAMRDRQPTWRGDADLRATSWIDGSGVDRGLAVHDRAFLIAARTAMPAILGADGPAARVERMSHMRKRVVILLAIEDAARYLPALQTCALQALRLSVAADGDGYRMALTAHYEAESFAHHAPTCLRALDERAAQLSSVVEWLARARNTPGSYSAGLTMGMTHENIAKLLEELAWALRSAERA